MRLGLRRPANDGERIGCTGIGMAYRLSGAAYGYPALFFALCMVSRFSRPVPCGSSAHRYAQIEKRTGSAEDVEPDGGGFMVLPSPH